MNSGSTASGSIERARFASVDGAGRRSSDSEACDVQRSPSQTAESEKTTATPTPAPTSTADAESRRARSGRAATAPAIRKTGALTAAKSQSMSISPCARYAGSASASASCGPARRRAAPTRPSAATTNSSSPTTPVSVRNCTGRLCGSVVWSTLVVR